MRAAKSPSSRRTGLNPVLFGETIIGQNQPNLTYMLAFKDMADRDQRWQVFRDVRDGVL